MLFDGGDDGVFLMKRLAPLLLIIHSHTTLLFALAAAGIGNWRFLLLSFLEKAGVLEIDYIWKSQKAVT
jgi:hypothetical protein